MRKTLITIGAAAILALSGAVALDAQRGPGRQGPAGGPGPNAVAQAPDGNAPDNGGRPGPGGRRGGGQGSPGLRGGLIPGITLADEQRTKVEAIVRTSRDQAAPIVDQLTLARKTLNREAFAEKRDNGKLSSLENNVVSLEKQLLDVRVRTGTAIADVLTVEQREVVRANGVGLDRIGGFGRGAGRGGPRGAGNPPGPGGQRVGRRGGAGA